GADDYILKPITPKMFLARLRAGQRVVKLQEELEADRDQLTKYSTELTSANERLQQQALTDALTALPNRRFAMERMAQEWALTLRGGRTLSCLMVDIDYFKRINDNYGHQVGDEALRLIADTLRAAARTQDLVCRYGGEEFVVICPDTKLPDAFKCAERLRLSVEAKKLKLQDGTELKMTISIGVAEKSNELVSVEKLLVQADNNLYAAKAAGRNRSVMNS
ncbi:MAG: diguanylate cyclase, partial [Gallionellaceae bacterium]